MEPQTNNRMQSAKQQRQDWAPAKPELIPQPPTRVFPCAQCGSLRTVVRITRPEIDVVQLSCLKCGGKFAVRNYCSNHAESRPVVERK